MSDLISMYVWAALTGLPTLQNKEEDERRGKKRRRGGESREGDVLGDMWKNGSICDHFSTYTDMKFSKTISLKILKMFI